MFKGIFYGDGIEVAVQVLNLQNKEHQRASWQNVKPLENIQHRNLVKIITSCLSVDFRGNDFKALVYDLMPNGSLEKWLHVEEQAPHQRHLNLMQRFNIATDVAFALEHLHFYCQPPFNTHFLNNKH